jgi:Protein of unknown function (DUF5132)
VALMDEKGRILLIGIVVGAAGAMLGREFFAPVRRLGRPLAKTALMSGLLAVERGREAIALMVEHGADLMAEVAAEREIALRQAK